MSDVKQAKLAYSSSQEVKWCAGCGDYSVLKQVQLALLDLGLTPEEVVFVSGIGCSSRFPYYVNSYGYHTIHGRGLAVATGVKCHNPELSVWVSVGDGDAMSIGGNHFIHAAKRNADIVCILMDNRIYGLTKGQVSPTSEKGKITKTTPYGSLEDPLDPARLALGAGATFVARSTDREQKLLRKLLVDAHNHKGFSLVHIMQNCLIFNDETFDPYVGKDRADNTVILQHGEPIIFGKEQDKAIILEGMTPKVAAVADVDPAQILIHDAHNPNSLVPGLLASLPLDDFPMPLGILRSIEKEVYDTAMQDQVNEVTQSKGAGKLEDLLAGKDTWSVA